MRKRKIWNKFRYDTETNTQGWKSSSPLSHFQNFLGRSPQEDKNKRSTLLRDHPPTQHIFGLTSPHTFNRGWIHKGNECCSSRTEEHSFPFLFTTVSGTPTLAGGDATVGSHTIWGEGLTRKYWCIITCLLLFWCRYKMINVGVQCNGG